MKKLTSLLIALVITLSANIFSFAATPQSTTFKSISEVIGFQSFQIVSEDGSAAMFNPKFVQLTEKALTRYYWDNEATKVKLNKEGGKESTLVLSKDKKSITFAFKYSSEGADPTVGFRYTKDTNGNLLVATFDEENIYSKPAIVTRYKSEAELLKQAPVISKKYAAASDKAYALYVAKEKLTRSKPVSNTNKLIGNYISTDKKWEIDIDTNSIRLSYQDGDLNYTYYITKLANAVQANKLVASTYTATYNDENTGKEIAATIKIVSSTRQKLMSVTVSSLSKAYAAAIGKVKFNYSEQK
jgi:hypothetical protein